MKTIIAYTVLVIIILACGKDKFDLSNVPKDDKYAKQILYFDHKKQAGKKEGKRELNDQIEFGVYVPDYTKEKGKEVCEFYSEFYKTYANEVGKKLTLSIDIWSKEVSKSESNNPDIQKKYLQGGMMRNYTNDVKEINLDDVVVKNNEPDTIKYYQKIISNNPSKIDERNARFMICFLYSEELKDTAKAIESMKAFLDRYPDEDEQKTRETVRMMLMMLGDQKSYSR